MATLMKRIEFRQRYTGYKQGLFILYEAKRLPKGQNTINLGQQLSAALLEIPLEHRKDRVMSVLSRLVAQYKEVSLTHIEILFTPYLELDVIGALASLCRNRKICITWPGYMLYGKAYYAEPGEPEYYEGDLSHYQETYIIDE